MQNKWAQQSKREKKSTVDEFRGTCTSTSSKILLLYNKEALDTYQTVYNNNINHLGSVCSFSFLILFLSGGRWAQVRLRRHPLECESVDSNPNHLLPGEEH